MINMWFRNLQIWYKYPTHFPQQLINIFICFVKALKIIVICVNIIIIKYYSDFWKLKDKMVVIVTLIFLRFDDIFMMLLIRCSCFFVTGGTSKGSMTSQVNVEGSTSSIEACRRQPSSSSPSSSAIKHLKQITRVHVQLDEYIQNVHRVRYVFICSTSLKQKHFGDLQTYGLYVKLYLPAYIFHFFFLHFYTLFKMSLINKTTVKSTIPLN